MKRAYVMPSHPTYGYQDLRIRIGGIRIGDELCVPAPQAHFGRGNRRLSMTQGMCKTTAYEERFVADKGGCG
jgi:hypothetical protein